MYQNNQENVRVLLLTPLTRLQIIASLIKNALNSKSFDRQPFRLNNENYQNQNRFSLRSQRVYQIMIDKNNENEFNYVDQNVYVNYASY